MRFIYAFVVVGLLVAGCQSEDAEAPQGNGGTETTMLAEERNAPEGYEEDPEAIRAVVEGGIPNGRWTEGLMFEGVAPMPWQKSASNWFPNTEDIQPDEIRIIFMGSSPTIRPGQANTCVFCATRQRREFRV